MSAEENKAVICRWIKEAWNQGNVNIADELYADDFIATDIDDPAKTLQGPRDIKQYVIATRSAFPDIHFTIDHLLAEGDKVVGAFTIRGTHKGFFEDIAPTGKQVIFKAVDIWRFANAKIVERCVASVDRLALLQQLDVLPALAKRRR